MDMSFEDLVRERAYHIWLAGGMASGLEHEHWVMAERAVKADVEPVVILTKAAKPTAKRAPKAKVAAKPATKIAKPAARKMKAEIVATH